MSFKFGQRLIDTPQACLFCWINGYNGGQKPSTNPPKVRWYLCTSAPCQLASMAIGTGKLRRQFFQPSLIIQTKFVNFRYMPLPYRIPFQSACGAFWTLYLSLLNSTYSFQFYPLHEFITNSYYLTAKIRSKITKKHCVGQFNRRAPIRVALVTGIPL